MKRYFVEEGSIHRWYACAKKSKTGEVFPWVAWRQWETELISTSVLRKCKHQSQSSEARQYRNLNDNRRSKIQNQQAISTPELFSFGHDWGREELWVTQKQASFSLVFAKNEEHADDWFILFRAKMKSLLCILLCEPRLLQIFEEGKAFWCWKFCLLIKMEFKDPGTPKTPCNVNLRACRCCASHFQVCFDAIKF